MSKPTQYIAGDKYSMLMLTGKSFVYFTGNRTRRAVECVCECGRIIYPLLESIRRNLVKSCGCIKKISNIKHGHNKRGVRHPLYGAWADAKQRCYNPQTVGYENWGGRGIKMCDEWKDDFQAFYNWAINNGWKKGLSLDRFPDNENGNYEPSNCRFTNSLNQNRNRRNNRLITAFGITKCLSEWMNDERCRAKSHKTIIYRLDKMKLSPEMAISNSPKYFT